LISKSAYHQVGRHEAIRASALEDVELGRLLKTAGFRLHALTAPGDVFVRMYESRAALWEGFGKNLAPLLGGKSVLLAVLNAVAFTGLLLAPMVLPFFAPIFETPLFHGIPLIGMIACRLISAREFRYPAPGLDLFLHPAASLGFFVLALSSIGNRIQKTARWKGRVLNP
jgi:hypothetical protein